MIPAPDHLPIALRAYAAAPKARKPRRGIGASDWTLTFDCETRTDASQALRFGAFQLRKGDAVKFAGLFYDPQELSKAEVETLLAYAKRHKLLAMTRDEFVDDYLFGRAYRLRARIVGFNLPFDISRLAVRHGLAKDAMYGGFTFTLSHQKFWPNVRIKHLSRRAAIMDFAAPFRQRDSRSQRNRGEKTPVRRGYFVDVSTLAHSLLSRGFDLGALSRFLEVPNPKLEFDDFDGPVCDEMLRYVVRDVQATWECYAALMSKLEALELPDLQPEQIFSEASLGKAYLRAMGIAPWREVQPDFPEDLMGALMSSYYGGRSEVRIRREVRQVILCDFLSMYPTVCTLMGLWRYVTASGMGWRDATAEAQSLLAGVSVEDLQSPDFWQKLSMLVKVLPDADIFPVRAAYEGEQLSTIAANYLSSDAPLWFTLADCIAAKLLTGKAPKVVEAIAFDPGPMQDGLRPVNISGKAEYRVDPVETDFFKRVIELRKETQGRMKAASGAEKVMLDGAQHNLKICGNSTSYGIWLQINVAKRSKRFIASIIGHDGKAFDRETNKAEKPGEFFHPLLGALITGAARLMLAITESLIERQGLEWAFCDTDSMAIAKPCTMAGDEFRNRVEEIANWFVALNPYAFPGSILKIESENDGLATGEPEPLYCWAVSSKRYALFNLASDGAPILRKVSAHGLGHLRSPYDQANPPADIPAADESVMRDGVERWHCDLWFEIVLAGLGLKPDMPRLDFHPAMNAPAVSRYGATAPELLGWFKHHNANRLYRDQVKPFGFLLSLSAKRNWAKGETIAPEARKGRPRKVSPVKPIAPFSKDSATIAATAFDRITGNAVPASDLHTYREAIGRYHLHPKSKFLNGDYLDRGTTNRRHIRASAIRYIGKEANEIDRQQVLGADSELDPEYGLSADSVSQFRVALVELVALVGKAGAAKALRIPPGRLGAILSDRAALEGAAAGGLSMRLPVEVAKARSAALAGEGELQRLREMIKELGLREAARRHGVDASNLRRKLRRM
ncbi:hypothetical protein SOQ14_02020 [Erythrobacter sp. T5W1-R]|uniref:hypothetical protein n=1 Tax=Erythrobacter sp. T5W1-R TaxID=3101752 RepID=UPI002AFEF85F|nr:hypothetical protein [Erythrobacter sp. T5W1-R]MEA1617684.1 hypothetical protein [Erythrobacter sp. T5W1-R]